MDLITLYDRVVQTLPLDTNAFMSHLNSTIDEFYAQYDEKYILTPGATKVYATSMDDGLNIYSEYTSAIVDNILYLASGDANKKTDYQAHVQMAYKRVWKRYHSERHLTKEVW